MKCQSDSSDGTYLPRPERTPSIHRFLGGCAVLAHFHAWGTGTAVILLLHRIIANDELEKLISGAHGCRLWLVRFVCWCTSRQDNGREGRQIRRRRGFRPGEKRKREGGAGAQRAIIWGRNHTKKRTPNQNWGFPEGLAYWSAASKRTRPEKIGRPSGCCRIIWINTSARVAFHPAACRPW